MVSAARSRGFTLVEVMVALAIVAITLPALLVTLYQQADDTAYLRDKTLAQAVAANVLTELRLRTAATGKLAKEKSDGSMRMAERDWAWRMQISQAPAVPNYFRVDIDVGLVGEEGGGNPLFKLAAFMSGEVASAAGTTGGGSGEFTDSPEEPGGG